jgi:predicted enzyme related to lactoylglutathione lyase
VLSFRHQLLETAMANHLAHFSVNVDDFARGRRFYERVFGWGFEAYGPPGFNLIHTDGPGGGGRVLGAMQQRLELAPGVFGQGYECTISVPDVAATAAAIMQQGGTILLPQATIPGVGTLVRFADTEGNVVCAMQYLDPTR